MFVDFIYRTPAIATRFVPVQSTLQVTYVRRQFVVFADELIFLFFVAEAVFVSLDGFFDRFLQVPEDFLLPLLRVLQLLQEGRFNVFHLHYLTFLRLDLVELLLLALVVGVLDNL